MNSILNSISSGDLLVLNVPRETSVKKDSIIELLQNSEIEFKTCPKLENSLDEFNTGFGENNDLYFDTSFDKSNLINPLYKENYLPEFQIEEKEEVSHTCNKNDVVELLQNSEIEFKTCPKLENSLQGFNTGFGENNDLHFESLCKKPELKTPLYLENFLSEFVTEELKAAARHALGLYNKDDVVAMSLLTAEDSLPNQQGWDNATIKQLRKGDLFFTPLTLFNAVYDSSGVTLEVRMKEMNKLISDQQKEFLKITQTSASKNISSLGDVTVFLQGFNNGDNLRETLDAMDQEMLRFEKTGLIEI